MLPPEAPPPTTTPPPAAQLEISAQPSAGGAPFEARFQATSTLSNPTVLWDFGDGASGQGAQVAHTYARAGTYTVTATATSGEQRVTGSATVSVSATGVVEPPVVVQAPDSLGPEQSQAGVGCSTAPAALLPLGLLAGLGVLRLRRRRHRS